MSSKRFDGLEYTREALAEELSLVERHARDGSAVDAGCACIEEKHLLNIAGLSSEGVTLAKSQAEKEFYMKLADLARNLRKNVVYEDWTLNGLLPASSPGVACLEKLERCIVDVKKTRPDANAFAVCRASVKCLK